MNTNSQQQTSIGSLLSFIFTILFVLHVMLLPVWFGIRGLAIFSTDDGFFSIFPAWFVGSAIVCLTLAIVFGMLPQPKTKSDVDAES